MISNAEGRVDPNVRYQQARGGCWYSLAEYIRSAYGNIGEPHLQVDYLGFRLALRWVGWSRSDERKRT